MADVLVFTSDPDSKAREFLESQGKAMKGAKVPVEVLRQNLADLLSNLQALLPKDKTEGQGFHLDEFEVSVGVNGKGEVGFMGTGVEIGGEASLKLTFKRQ